jgi:hypothetical protein
MLLAACEGYLDKERDQSNLTRLQTLLIVQSNGAKRKWGGDLIATDMWLLQNEQVKTTDIKVWGTVAEAQEIRDKLICLI